MINNSSRYQNVSSGTEDGSNGTALLTRITLLESEEEDQHKKKHTPVPLSNEQDNEPVPQGEIYAP